MKNLQMFNPKQSLEGWRMPVVYFIPRILLPDKGKQKILWLMKLHISGLGILSLKMTGIIYG